MNKLTSIILASLLGLATTTFAQDNSATPPDNHSPAATEVQSAGFHVPAFQKGWDENKQGPAFRGGPRGPRGPMMGHGPQGKQGDKISRVPRKGQRENCKCPCHGKQKGGEKGKRPNRGESPRHGPDRG